MHYIGMENGETTREQLVAPQEVSYLVIQQPQASVPSQEE